MKKLQLPSSYAVLSEEEQRTVSGGGELKDSLDEFLGSLHLHDFTLGEGLVSFSVTFVPMLLFTASLPADKMAAFGANYRDDAAVQIDWGLWYIAQAYGSPSKAWQHSEQVGWY